MFVKAESPRKVHVQRHGSPPDDVGEVEHALCEAASTKLQEPADNLAQAVHVVVLDAEKPLERKFRELRSVPELLLFGDQCFVETDDEEVLTPKDMEDLKVYLREQFVECGVLAVHGAPGCLEEVVEVGHLGWFCELPDVLLELGGHQVELFLSELGEIFLSHLVEDFPCVEQAFVRLLPLLRVILSGAERGDGFKLPPGVLQSLVTDHGGHFVDLLHRPPSVTDDLFGDGIREVVDLSFLSGVEVLSG